jgi:uncharacterized protein YkwD
MGAAGSVLGQGPALAWKTMTSSPRAGTTDAANAQVQALCGEADAALFEVATWSARRKASGAPTLGADELTFGLRASGDPHVWARAWSLAGALGSEDVVGRVRAWTGAWNTLGVRRCGVARAAAADGGSVVSVIAVDALADLSPLPTSTRVGQWLTLDGTMLIPASAAKVVLLGPRGAPKSVPASLTGRKIRSSFAVDQPGGWVVQVLATVSTGPRPVLEASVYAGTPPPDQFVPAPAPGEAAAQGAKDDDDGMLRMINAARVSEGLLSLTRDPELDRVARAHSQEMLKAGVVGHDVGTGDPKARATAASIVAHAVGENVATSKTLEGAHRALWASPSHRENTLMSQFTRVGVAVLRAPDGMVWVTAMFAG